MNEKLFKLLKDKCKDMGISEKVIIELATLGSDDLTDESTDEKIQATADSLVPFARLTQGEVTRKLQDAAKKRTDGGTVGYLTVASGAQTTDDDMPEWFKKYQEAINKEVQGLKTELDLTKAERLKTERQAQIDKRGKELGIPDTLMKHLNLPENADFETLLTEYKQELVTSKLVPENSGTNSAKGDGKATKEITDAIVKNMNV